MKKKIAGLLFAFCMLFVILPMHASAEGEPYLRKDHYEPALDSEIAVNMQRAAFTRNNTVYSPEGGYGAQLTEFQKEMYDALVDFHIDGIMANTETGNLTIEFEDKPVYPSGDDWLKEAQYAYWAFEADYPQVFWTAGITHWTWGLDVEDGYQVWKVEFVIDEKYTDAKTEVEEYNAAVLAAAEEIYGSVTTRKWEYDYYKAIHDWLCNNASYNYDAVDYPDQYRQAYTSAGIFTGDHRVVCQGYGEAFKVLCDVMNYYYSSDNNGADNLYNVQITGVTNTGAAHLWNYVYLPDGKWYAVDVTWDDQSTIYYTYFLAGANTKGFQLTFGQEHMGCGYLSTDSSITVTYPVLSDEAYEIPEVNTPDEVLKFKSASLTLEDNLAINFKVEKRLFTEAGYENPYVKFMLNDVETVVTEYREDDTFYIFDFANIAPNQMNDEITAVLYAEYDGYGYESDAVSYGVYKYCYNQLKKTLPVKDDEFKTLLVDLLNYGAASQVYLNYNVDALVNADLTEEQSAWGTSGERAYVTVQDPYYATVQNPMATWKGAGLNLTDRVQIRLKLAADSITNLYVKVQTESGWEWAIPAEEFEEVDGIYYVYFNGLNAAQLSEAVYFTVYSGDTAVSNTLSYSVESYVYSQLGKDTTTEEFAALLKTMMNYGDAAYNYVY